MSVTEILFATKNTGKLREVQNLFSSLHISIRGLDAYPEIGDIPETGSTFEENAKIKAETVFKLLQIPVLADDSGLAVSQLGGRPGVHSARYAGEDADDAMNNRKLQSELGAFPEPHFARYVCCAVYFDGTNTIFSVGESHGRIIGTPRGTGGFGYDPYFVPVGYTLTMAELPLSEKNKISHRGKAFLDLYNKLLSARLL